jgi:hypothetical protein
MSRRVGALLLRYLLLIRRDYSRVVDLVYWPLLGGASPCGALHGLPVSRAVQVPNALAMLLGGAILWNVFLRGPGRQRLLPWRTSGRARW